MTFQEALQAAGVDVETTLRRFGGNEGMLARFVKKFPQDPTYEALQHAVEASDYEAVEQCAHTLKGTSANLGFQALSNECAALVATVRESNYAQVTSDFARVSAVYEALRANIQAIEV